MRRISGVHEGRFINDAEKLAGRLLAELQFSTVEDIFEIGLHTYIDVAQSKLNSIGEALFQAYIFQPFQLQEEYELRQQEEQQQQTGPRQTVGPEPAEHAGPPPASRP
jgi:hypothetical protein